MSGSIARELVLPALRLDVPSRPTREHLAVLAERSADEWTTAVTGWTGDQVVRLDLATGEELRRTRTLDQLPAPGNVVTPGYDGTFFYAGLGGGLHALRPDGTTPPPGGCRR